jgi:hypothetical protein
MILGFSPAAFVWTGTLLLAGVAVGLVYFAALRSTVTLLTIGRGWSAPAMLTLGRILAVVLFLGLAVQLGALPMLAAFAGFLMARGIALRAVRSTG